VLESSFMAKRPVFLVTEPSCFDVHYRINPWMRPDAWRTDPETRRAAAMQSSADLQSALSAAGASVETIPGVEGLPDLVFPANAAVVLDGRVYQVHAYRAAIADAALAHLPRFVIYNGLNAWGKHREVPHPPAQTFHSWYQANRGGEP